MTEPPYPLRGRRVYVAGHGGMVGAACLRRLAREDCAIITAPHAALDLTRQAEAEDFLLSEKPDIVIVAAAKVGGILANDTLPAEFLYQNLLIGANLVHAAHLAGVNRLLFLGSSCIYPREAPPPIAESALLTGRLEPTNEWYAVAKIAGIKLCQAYRKQYGRDYIAAMPCNLYGPGDFFHPAHSHVIPALMHRFREAAVEKRETVTCWGTGLPRREFLHVDDLADACVFLLRHYGGAAHVNVGTGADMTIAALAEAVARVTGFTGRIQWDPAKPDGAMNKRMDVSKLREMGWSPGTGFMDGLVETFNWFRAQETLRQ